MPVFWVFGAFFWGKTGFSEAFGEKTGFLGFFREKRGFLGEMGGFLGENGRWERFFQREIRRIGNGFWAEKREVL